MILAGLIGAVFASDRPAEADGVVRVFESPVGCWAVEWYTVGMIGDGAGTIELDPAPGTVVFANLSWNGRNDLTPDLIGAAATEFDEIGIADSDLTVNGVTVSGVMAEGNAGHAPRGGWDWYNWSRDLGPDGLDIVDETTTTVDLSGWDTVDNLENNGALLTIVYDTSPCTEATVVDVYEGLDYFFHHSGQPETGTLFVPVFNAPTPTTVRLPFGLAGSDFEAPRCRGVGLWFTAGSGPIPEFQSFQLVHGIGEDGGAEGVNATGIYDLFDGVEILNDPFTKPEGECVPRLNPIPDQPYEAGHAYPGGANDAPYRALALTEPSGADADADISLALVDVLIPANSDWIGFQMESENDDKGESGAWIASQSIRKPVPGALGDYAWFDKNTNCLQDPGETGVVGVQADLFADGVLESTQFTTADDETTDLLDETGRYLFTGLGPFTSYEVQFTAPDGYAFTAPNCAAATNDEDDSDAVALVPGGNVGITTPISLAPAEDELTLRSDLSWDVGLIRPADVELFKRVANSPTGPFVDTIQLAVGDSAFYEVVVNAELIDAAGLPFADALDVVVEDLLPPGVSPVEVTVDVGTYDLATNVWDIGDMLAGSTATAILEVTVSDTGTHRNVAQVIEMSNEDIDSTPNNGEVDPPEDDLDIAIIEVVTASIGDYVWVDGNANACQDLGEVGIPGVTVELLLDGVVVETQQTDADGRYLFTDLIPGDYTVRFGSVSGYVETAASLCEGGSNTEMDSDPTSTPVTIVGNDVVLEIDHGFVPLSSLGDRVFFDTNGDGCQAFDETEGPVVGATVVLLLDGVEVDRTQTDEDGRYLFDQLLPGQYTVQFDEAQLGELGRPSPDDEPAALSPTDADCGSDELDSDGPTVVVNLPPGTNNDTVDIGIVPPVPPLPPDVPPPPRIPMTGANLAAGYLGLLLACAGLTLVLLRRALKVTAG